MGERRRRRVCRACRPRRRRQLRASPPARGGALEIGYWVHAAFVRRGIASKAAALLTDAAFAIPDIERVEIHHDKANSASAGVPRRLGYRFVGEQRDEVTAPADSGIECVWRIERDEWPGSRTYVSAADRVVG